MPFLDIHGGGRNSSSLKLQLVNNTTYSTFGILTPYSSERAFLLDDTYAYILHQSTSGNYNQITKIDLDTLKIVKTVTIRVNSWSETQTRFWSMRNGFIYVQGNTDGEVVRCSDLTSVAYLDNSKYCYMGRIEQDTTTGKFYLISIGFSSGTIVELDANMQFVRRINRNFYSSSSDTDKSGEYKYRWHETNSVIIRNGLVYYPSNIEGWEGKNVLSVMNIETGVVTKYNFAGDKDGSGDIAYPYGILIGQMTLIKDRYLLCHLLGTNSERTNRFSIFDLQTNTIVNNINPYSNFPSFPDKLKPFIELSKLVYTSTKPFWPISNNNVDPTFLGYSFKAAYQGVFIASLKNFNVGRDIKFNHIFQSYGTSFMQIHKNRVLMWDTLMTTPQPEHTGIFSFKIVD